jgi:hypothetical protein
LSTGHVRTVRDDAGNKLGISEEAIVLDPLKDKLPIRVLRTALKVAGAAFVVGAALYLALAVTVVAVMGSGDKHAIVVRGAFPGGIAAQGDFAFISAQPYDRSVMGKVEQAFVGVPGGSTVQTVALPGTSLTTSNGQIMADKKATGFYGTPPQATLGHEYLAFCISGSGCITGSLVVVPDDRVVGQVHRFVGFSGLVSPITYRR